MEALVPPLWPTVVAIAVVISVAGLAWLVRDRRPWYPLFTERFYYGVPWGSLLALGFVVLVYLVVQDGISNFRRPVFLPFVNWSYLYPTGVIFASFAHGSAAHLIGNMVTAAVLAPIAEYIWGHYPDEPTDRIRDHPAVRAFVFFPSAVLGLGLFTSLFTWGPVIGFSGVVFGLAGFTVVRFPIITIVALLGRSAIQSIGQALLEPVEVAEVGRVVFTPAWAGISFQGHALGFLMGAFLGVLLLHYREISVEPVRLWLGTILVMIGMGIWAIWTTGNEDTYVLYRGLGFALLFLVGLLITVAAVASDREIKGWLTRRKTAVIVLAIPILILVGIAIPLNILTVADYQQPDRAITVDGYDVFYDPDTESHLQPLVAPPDEPGTTGGVIVVDEDRHIWTTAVSSTDLGFAGEGTVVVGDIMRRADVDVERTGWDPVGNDSVYLVELRHDEDVVPTYAANESEADQRIAGYRIAIDADLEDGFSLLVTDPDGEVTRTAMPEANASTTVGDLSIERNDDRLVAVTDDSRVFIAEREND